MFFHVAACARLEKVARKFFSGSSLGSVMGPITALAYDSEDCWKIPAGEKSKVYGRDGAVFVGGPCEAVPKPKMTGDMEPLSWHSSHPKLLGELLHETFL